MATIAEFFLFNETLRQIKRRANVSSLPGHSI
jgi:hypothetical protein